MNSTRTWLVAGATLAIAGFGTAVAAASDDTAVLTLNDPQPVAVAHQFDDNDDDRGTWLADNSPESADSPAESPFDSADSGLDSPNDNPAGGADSASSATSTDSSD